MHNRRIGYIRIQGKKDADSLHMDGNLHAIFTDKAEKNDNRRPQLKATLDFCEQGDLLLVERMNSLAENPTELLRRIRDFTDKGVSVEFKKEDYIFTQNDDPLSMLVAIMVTEFRQQQPDKKAIPIAQATNTKEKSVTRKTSKNTLSDEQINELKKRAAAGENKTLLARDFAISKEALHAYLRTDRKNLDA